jgi:hypothetical protein
MCRDIIRIAFRGARAITVNFQNILLLQQTSVVRIINDKHVPDFSYKSSLVSYSTLDFD